MPENEEIILKEMTIDGQNAMPYLKAILPQILLWLKKNFAIKVWNIFSDVSDVDDVTIVHTGAQLPLMMIIMMVYDDGGVNHVVCCC